LPLLRLTINSQFHHKQIVKVDDLKIAQICTPFYDSF